MDRHYASRHPQVTLKYRKSGKPIKSKQFPYKKDPIFLIYQYYLYHNNNNKLQQQRQHELITCLQKNCKNEHIDKIFLLNERIYTKTELGLQNSKDYHKVQQINIGHRLLFNDIFKFIHKNKINGYIIFGNADIFYDDTLKNIFTSELFYKKSIFCQTRLDWNDTINRSQLPNIHHGDLQNGSSQDSWILHSRWAPMAFSLLTFYFGQGGCDNYFCFIMAQLDFNVYNEPFTIQANHYHQSALREWREKPHIHMQILCIPPYIPIMDSRV